MARKWFEDAGAVVELLDLNYPLENLDIWPDSDNNDLFNEQKNLDWDTKAYMYGRVVNKHARHNLCFGQDSQDPIMNQVREELFHLLLCQY